MRRILSLFKKTTLYSAVLALSTFSVMGPLANAAYAEECNPPSDASYGAGVHHPVGSEAVMFTYDCGSDTWNSQYYAYHPASNTKSPKFAPDYSYDCAAGSWSQTTYYFSPGDNAYHKSRVAAGDPGLATNCPAAPSSNPTTSSGVPTTENSGSAAASTNGVSTGPGSTNTTANSGSISIGSTNNNTLGMNNGISSQAGSGNAGVFYNTTGGSAASGNAQSLANIANVLQSSANVFGPDTATFTADINGDVNGDFMFDPAAVMGTGPGSTNASNNAADIKLNQANDTQAAINNTIDVGATSGDAAVANNTNGGDATSGNANAIVNLMNLINSTVSAGQSFVGTININGNLNGDILLPQNLLNQLLAATGPGSTNTSDNGLDVTATDTNNTTSTIANNVNATANTGDATVASNTSGGDATTGSAKTNVTLLNLTGSEVVGANDLLVFVNVLGHWVGMIMNAPAGSTAASLGGGITSTGPGSTNSTSNDANLAATSTVNNNFGITNNVNAHSQTGDASVTGNTKGGNATSGNANTAVNVLNIAQSKLNLSNWFGILFINVFGNWTGSFGINTSAGDTPATTSTETTTTSGGGTTNSSQQFASFVSRASRTSGSGSASTNTAATTTDAVLGTSTAAAKKISKGIASTATNPTPDNAAHASYALPLIGFGAAAIILLFSERDRIFRKKH